jgi:hypothetical protein
VNNRVSFDFSKEGLRGLNDLVKRLDADSKAEVVRRSLALMDYATKDGEAIVIVRFPDGSERTLVPK